MGWVWCVRLDMNVMVSFERTSKLFNVVGDVVAVGWELELGLETGKDSRLVDGFDEVKCQCCPGANIHVVVDQFSVSNVVSMSKVEHRFIRLHA